MKRESITKMVLTKLAEMAVAHFEAFQWPYWKRYDKATTYSTFYRLKGQGLVKFKKEKDKTLVKITEKGKKRVLKYNLDTLKIKKPKKWDRKWRIVIFDIPNKKRLARNVLRNKLKELGFYPLQKSVFVFPYECKNEIDFIKRVYEITPYVKFIVGDSIEGGEKILKYYNL